MSDKKYGVYVITNNVNLKMYIGKGEVRDDLTCSRWKDHITDCCNQHLNDSIAKHGVDNFAFGWLEVDRSEYAALMLEQKHIAFWMTTDREFGYNKTWGGEGMRPSEETRAKLSASKKGTKLSASTRAKMSEAHTGKVKSEETRAKMSKNNAMHDPEKRTKVSATQKGRHFSEEHKQKLCAAKQAYWSGQRAAGGRVPPTTPG